MHLKTSRLIITGLFASALLATEPTTAPPNYLPSEQQALTFIAKTIDWYRHLPTAQRIGTEPADLLFLEDNRAIAKDVVRLSFEFGKAVVAIRAPRNPAAGGTAPDLSVDLQYLAAANAKLDANTQQAVEQLKSINQARLTARGADWKRLDAQRSELQGRIQVLKAISANYRDLQGLVGTTTVDPDRATDMAILVDNLERTVPDVSASAPSQSANIPVEPSRPSYGITGLIYRVYSLGRKEQVIDGLIERTDGLTGVLKEVRTPIRDAFRKELSKLSLDATSLDLLQQQQSRMTNLVTQVGAASPAVAALLKQQTLLNLYSSHLAEWRSAIQLESRAAWKALVTRLLLLAAAVATLLGLNVMARRLARTHVRDADTRQVLLMGERFLLWLLIILAVMFAFALDLSSLATFLGLLSAGLAVGLHDVLLAVGGYLLLVRRFRVRVGDRVEISGVNGEVTDLGLMQFEVSEIDARTGIRTGRSVFFSNSYVFVSPATPLFRELSGQAVAYGNAHLKNATGGFAG